MLGFVWAAQCERGARARAFRLTLYIHKLRTLHITGEKMQNCLKFKFHQCWLNNSMNYFHQRVYCGLASLARSPPAPQQSGAQGVPGVRAIPEL